MRPQGLSEIILFNQRIGSFKKQQDYGKYVLLLFSFALFGVSQPGAPKRAVSEYKRMLKLKIAPDAITYNVMMQIMGKINRPDKAQQFFDLMTKHNVTPNTQHYNALLSAHSAAGNMSACEEILRDMRTKFVARDKATYTIFIKSYARIGRFSDAERHYYRFLDQKRARAGREDQQYAFAALKTLLESYNLCTLDWKWMMCLQE